MNAHKPFSWLMHPWFDIIEIILRFSFRGKHSIYFIQSNIKKTMFKNNKNELNYRSKKINLNFCSHSTNYYVIVKIISNYWKIYSFTLHIITRSKATLFKVQIILLWNIHFRYFDQIHYIIYVIHKTNERKCCEKQERLLMFSFLWPSRKCCSIKFSIIEHKISVH